ncbi:peptidoglycan-binding protein [Massilia psychrophila]|nr:FimV/HubP family polar landmark protein [Massilia psychrophila]GGE63632.1 peptidoglycan-binding protein [Massilia psychrophila]
MSLALKTLYGAVASAVFFSSVAYAAGLGKLTVLSALGQPLRAEIELTAVSNEEASALVAKLAPPDAFKLANIEFNPALLSLRFAVEQRNGRQYIKISSSQPVNEPFVDMLLELSWNSGRLVREYTFLLDPPELRATQPAQVAAAGQPAPKLAAAAPALASQPAPAAQLPQPQAAQPARPKPERQDTAAAVPAAASQYKVKSGDTLGRIAAQLKPVDVSLDMMLVALFRTNPDSFVANNMNRLKSGQILSVPDSDAIKGGSDSEARGVVVAHAADFNDYRNKLAGQVANAAPAKAQDTGQSAAGKITAKVEERATAANESKDQLKLSKAGAAGKNAAPVAEDTIAKDRALADATERVKELERNVNDLEKLMLVKSRAGTTASAGKLAAVADVTTEVKPAAPAGETLPAPSPQKVAQKPAPAPVAPVAPVAPTLVDTLMDNITLIGAGAAVLLLALFGLSRRKKRGAAGSTEPSILGAPTNQAHSLFAETGGQSVDTSNSVFNSSFAPSASQLDTNEVDPVAEADVYIAYGRDAQAEEILKEALRSHPERYPVRLKLLEIYAARKDQRAFETQAGEMYGMTRGQGADWAQAAALGLVIDPLNPLYASTADAPPLAPAASTETIAEQAILNQMHDEGLAADDHLLMDLDGNQLDALAEETIVAAPAIDHAQDDHTLDFDLGGLDFEPLASTQPSAAAAAAAAADPHDLAFNVEPIAAAAPDAPAAQEQSFDLAFDLAFDAPATPNPAPATAPKSLDDMPFDLNSNDLSSDFQMADLVREFDLPKLPEPAAAPFAAPLADLDAMDFAAPALATAAPSNAQGPQFDMSGIDLDLPAEFAAGSPPAIAGGAPADLSFSHMEMETKLDLAIAYQEIGDREGARELLDEVIKGGSIDQVGKANDMRSKLV